MAIFDWLSKKKAPLQPKTVVAPRARAVAKPVTAAVADNQAQPTPKAVSAKKIAPRIGTPIPTIPAPTIPAPSIKAESPSPTPPPAPTLAPTPAPAQAPAPMPTLTTSPTPPAPLVPIPDQSAPAVESPGTKQAQFVRDRSLYQTILGGLYDAVLIVDPKGYVIGSNKRTELVFGMPEHELWQMACTKLVSGLSPMVLGKIRDHVANGRFMVMTATCIKNDGTLIPTEIACSRINFINDYDLLLSIRNNERHELENEALRHTYAGLMVCNYDGMIEYVNPTLLRMLNYAEDHEMQKHFLGDFCASLQAAEMILRAPSESTSWIGQISLLSAKGQMVNVMASSIACPPRQDGQRRVIITLIPSAKDFVRSGPSNQAKPESTAQGQP